MLVLQWLYVCVCLIWGGWIVADRQQLVSLVGRPALCLDHIEIYIKIYIFLIIYSQADFQEAVPGAI